MNYMFSVKTFAQDEVSEQKYSQLSFLCKMRKECKPKHKKDTLEDLTRYLENLGVPFVNITK